MRGDLLDAEQHIAAEAEHQRKADDAEIICIVRACAISYDGDRDKSEARHEFAKHSLKRAILSAKHNAAHGKSNRERRKNVTQR